MKTIINGLNKFKAGQQIDDAELRYRICEEAKKAVMRSTPMKVVDILCKGEAGRCPNCQQAFLMDDEGYYCKRCGQALDWSEK